MRVTLLPDKKHRLETKIKRRTLNPRWNETFYFEGFPIQKLQSRVLHLHVFDYDRFSRDDSIGEVFLPLCQVFNTQTLSTYNKPLRTNCLKTDKLLIVEEFICKKQVRLLIAQYQVESFMFV